jgi:hypothetical protein
MMAMLMMTFCCGRHKNIALVSGVFHGHDLVAFRGLQGVDRVDFVTQTLASSCAGAWADFAHVTVACNHANLACGIITSVARLMASTRGLRGTVQAVELDLRDQRSR